MRNGEYFVNVIHVKYLFRSAWGLTNCAQKSTVIVSHKEKG